MAKKKKGDMSFIGHLDVMRKHIIRVVRIALLLFAVAFYFTPQYILPFVEGPAHREFITYDILCDISQGMEYFCSKFEYQFHNLELMGQFTLHFRIAFMVTLVFIFPYAFWEVWKFIKPALRKREKRVTRWLTFFVSILFTVGAFFGFYVITPIAVKFFMNYELSDMITNTVQYKSYFKFLSTSVLATGVMFQLPITIYFFSKLGVVGPRFLRKYRKHAIIIILLISAIITPPDVFSQILISLPIFILYEISILISALTGRKERKRLKKEEEARNSKRLDQMDI